MTVNDWYRSLQIGTHKRPTNVTKHDINYQVTGHVMEILTKGYSAYGKQFPNLTKFNVNWIDDDTFELTCRHCGR